MFNPSDFFSELPGDNFNHMRAVFFAQLHVMSDADIWRETSSGHHAAANLGEYTY